MQITIRVALKIWGADFTLAKKNILLLMFLWRDMNRILISVSENFLFLVTVTSALLLLLEKDDTRWLYNRYIYQEWKISKNLIRFLFDNTRP